MTIVKIKPASVFVPYEMKTVLWERCNDLPRFTQPKQVIDYLGRNPQLANRRLDWREEFDADSIHEYMLGVGEPRPRSN